MPLGKKKAKDVVVLCERRHRFAREDNAAFRDGHAQNATGAGGENGSSSPLLFYDASVGFHRGEVSFGDVENGARLIQLHLRADAPALKILNSIEVGSRLITLGLLRSNSLIERLSLQDELLILYDRDLLPGGNHVAFANLERNDRPADARAGDELPHRLNRGDDGLSVLDLPRGDHDLRGLDHARGQQWNNRQ